VGVADEVRGGERHWRMGRGVRRWGRGRGVWWMGA
jgi:hypothetical protein